MRYATLLTSLLATAAVSVPALAWAAPDCGNPPVKTAEVVHQIPTPQQALAPQVEIIAPQVAPQVETVTRQVETVAPVQFETRSPQPVFTNDPVVTQPAPQIIEAPVKTAQVVATPANRFAAAYEAVLQRRISKGAGGLNVFDYAGAKAAGEGRVIKAYTDHLASQNPDQLPQADQIAYWANLYNAWIITLLNPFVRLSRARFQTDLGSVTKLPSMVRFLA